MPHLGRSISPVNGETYLMRNRFKYSMIVAVAMVGVLSVAMKPAAGQARAYRALRSADGKPNINGIWQAINEANWDLTGHAARAGLSVEMGAWAAEPASLGFVEGGQIPYLPAALAKKKTNFDNRIKLDPEVKCYL